MGCAFNANQFFLGGSSALKDGFCLVCGVGLFANALIRLSICAALSATRADGLSKKRGSPPLLP